MKRFSFLGLFMSLVFGCAVCAQPGQAVVGERGNWVRQRGWVKEAQSANEQIQKDASVVKKSRDQFMVAFEKVDKKINEFYGSKGFVRGKVDSIVADLKADMEKDKQRRLDAAKKRSENDDTPINFYDVHREAIELDVTRFEREAEQLNLDMKSVVDLDKSLSDRLKAVDKQIKDGSDLAVQAAKKLEEMWWIIDDQKACDAYYVIQGFADKVAAIKKYLNETLFSDFKMVISTIEKQIDQLNKQIELIEQRGLIIAHRASRLAKKEVPDVLAVVEDEVADEAATSAVRERRPKVVVQTWAEYLLGLPGRFIEYLTSFWSRPVVATVRKRQPVVDEESENT